MARMRLKPGTGTSTWVSAKTCTTAYPRPPDKVKPSSSLLRISYAGTLETPFNENLVLSSSGCSDPVLSPLLLCNVGASGTLHPGYRNEFHAGLQQALGRYLVFNGEYIWKYTHNAFDFSVLGNTPITFPIDWHNSKIPGYAMN